MPGHPFLYVDLGPIDGEMESDQWIHVAAVWPAKLPTGWFFWQIWRSRGAYLRMQEIDRDQGRLILEPVIGAMQAIMNVAFNTDRAILIVDRINSKKERDSMPTWSAV